MRNKEEYKNNVCKDFFVKPCKETIFPASRGPINELECKLRHSSTEITKGERMVLADILEAYKHIINDCTQKERNRVCSEINKLSKGDRHVIWDGPNKYFRLPNGDICGIADERSGEPYHYECEHRLKDLDECKLDCIHDEGMERL